MNHAETKQSQLVQLIDQVRKQVKIYGWISDIHRELDQARSRESRMQDDLEKAVAETKKLTEQIEGGYNNHFIVDSRLFTLTSSGGIHEIPATTIPAEKGHPSA